MPTILRAVHVDQLPEGTSVRVKLRGEKVILACVGGAYYAFDAAKTSLPAKPALADVTAASRDGVAFRTVVRGSYVHVALDADRQSAHASIQENGHPAQTHG